MPKNTFRSKAFIKIKHNIEASRNTEHINCCKLMMEVATPILSKDEIVILKEFIQEKETEFAPVVSVVVREKESDGEYMEDHKEDYYEDEIDNMYHKKNCGANGN